MQDILARLLAGETLPESEAARAFEFVLTGRANESQVGAMLALIAVRGPALDELVGGARVMRAHATRVPVPDAIRDRVIDTCGTGGTAKTFNISTGAAIVAAGARGTDSERVYVAKHGGRSRSGRGSAEILQALGVNVDAPAPVQSRCLEEAGVCFSFAVNHHPAMKFAAGPRKSLGFPTIFNLLGPLTNPAGAARQLMGVYDERALELVAQTLARLGCARAMVVRGEDGMDELSTCAPTRVVHVEGASVRTETFDARSLGFARATHEELAARDLDEAARLLRSIVTNAHAGPERDIVVLNAGAALVVGGAAETVEAGVELATRSIEGGGAAEALDTLARVSNTP
ncbi:MAG: anthranilate phosphoribosyltransferase [Planctomycetota bacterium]